MFVKSRESRVESRDRGEERGARSEIRFTLGTPHSTLPRGGLSLTEVLIAMGILTIGLLGVASVFPVGSFYMQKAEIADRGSAIANSVMSDVVSRGMLNPRAWYVMVPFSSNPAPYNAPFPSDGKQAPTLKSGTFGRPFGVTLNEALNQATAATDRMLLAKQFGSAYVIDPLGISVMAFEGSTGPGQSTAYGPAALFPATAYGTYGYYVSSSAWLPWTGGNQNSQFQWPIRRVTFRQSSSGWHMDPQMAEHFFRGSDDVTYDFPNRADRPAIQNLDFDDVNKNGKPDTGERPLARKWTGDYSWIVSVAPTTNAARDGMSRNPEGFAYDVSVVVFYKRVLPEKVADVFGQFGANARYLSAMGANERTVKASVVSTGLNGGELLLTDWGDYYDPSGTARFNAFDHLRTGQWIMLCGPHPNSNVTMSNGVYVSGESRFALNWYQVLSIESEGIAITNPATQRLVALRGPQWPWQPSAAGADNLCVAICKGAVAVHAKTMRLEGHSGSAGASGFGSAGNPTTKQEPFGHY